MIYMYIFHSKYFLEIFTLAYNINTLDKERDKTSNPKHQYATVWRQMLSTERTYIFLFQSFRQWRNQKLIKRGVSWF